MLQAASTSENVSKLLPDYMAKKPENCELWMKIILNSLRIRV
jgi:hypothetical protein